MSWKLTDLHAVMSLHKTVRVEERLVAALMIRDLDDDVKARLRVQAAEHGRSMEAEGRLLLAAA